MEQELLNDEFMDQVAEIAYNNFKDQREEERLDPDPDKVKEFKQQYLKPLYPYTFDVDGSKRKYKCCEAFGQSPGAFCCCSSNPPDKSYIDFGEAICLMLKFLKHSNIIYFFISLLALTACVVCFMVAVQNDLQPTGSYTTFFFATSYGSFAAQYNKCQYSKINTITNQASFSMRCPYGKINATVTTTVLPAVLTDSSLNSLYNCRNERKNLEQSRNLAYPYLSVLSSKQVTLSNDNRQADITLTFNGSQPYPLVSFVYECYDNTYNLGVISTESKNFFYYVVAVDLAIIFFFFIFFCSEIKAEDEEARFFQLNQVSLNDFTIKIEGLQRNTLEKELNYLFPEFSRQCPEFNNSLIDLSIPQIHEEMEQREYRRQLYQKYYKLLNKYYFKDIQGELRPYEEVKQIIENEMSEEDKAEFKRKLKKYTYQLLTLKRRDILKEVTEDMEAYLIFDNVIVRERVMAIQQSHCCVEKVKYMDPEGVEREYLLKNPPVPDMINWENRYKWTKIRTVISWLIVLMIVAGCYLLLGFIQYKQSQLNTDYNYQIDCAVLFPGINLTVFDATLAAQSNDYQTCYCKDKSVFNGIEDACRSWNQKYIIYKIIPLLISLAIVVLNVIVGQIFKLLSKFQKQNDDETEQMSYAFKRGFLLMMNMGLVMILLNINYNNSTKLQEVSFIFLGKFDDFTSDWYFQIGAIIILTMIFNIAFSIIEAFMACSLRCLKKLWDTRCCTKITSRETKQEYIDLHSDQIYPIGERYAYLMATFIISMAFSGVIPILVPVTFLSFFLLLFADKILLFKYYQKPPYYTSSLHRSFLVVVYISLMIHFGLTAFFLAQPTLISKEAYISSEQFYPSTNNIRITNIFKTGYILPYVIMFFLMLIYAVLRKCFWGTIMSCFEKCTKSNINYKSEVVQKMKLFQMLSPEQRQSLRRALQIKRSHVEFKKKERTRHNIVFPIMGVEVSETEKPDVQFLLKEEEIIVKTLEKLKQCKASKMNEGQDWYQKLLGLVSYDECVKSRSAKKDEEMILFQKRLKNLVSHVHKKPQSSLFVTKNNNDTNTNLVPEHPL